MIGIDTNLLLRYLTQDDAAQSKQGRPGSSTLRSKPAKIFI